MADNYTYYFSDPDSADKKMHCLVINLPVDLSGNLPWHWHTKKPDESLKDPVWSVKLGDFVENDKDSQAAILAEAQEKINALDQAKQSLDSDIKQVQATEQQSAAQSLALTKGLQQVMQTQQTTNKLIGSMQTIMLGLKNQLETSKDAQQGGNK